MISAEPGPQRTPGCLKARLTQASSQGLERGARAVRTGAFLESFLEEEGVLLDGGDVAPIGP